MLLKKSSTDLGERKINEDCQKLNNGDMRSLDFFPSLKNHYHFFKTLFSIGIRLITDDEQKVAKVAKQVFVIANDK